MFVEACKANIWDPWSSLMLLIITLHVVFDNAVITPNNFKASLHSYL